MKKVRFDMETEKKKTYKDYDRVMLTCPKGTKELYKEEAEKRSRNLSNFICVCIENELRSAGLL